MSVKIFCSYAHKDERLLKKLKSHLRLLQRQGLIDVWHDRDINAGTEWEREISQRLNEADIILLLISPDFMDSDYCYSIEMKRALERHERGEASVIPIILRHVYWQGEPLGKLQALPTDAKPITDPNWVTQDRAFYQVTQGILKVVDNIMQSRVSLPKYPVQTSKAKPSNLASASIKSEPIISTKKQLSVLVEKVQAAFNQEAKEPLKVSIMGQAGVGKSTLINTFFNTNLSTDPMRPTTKHIEAAHVKGKSNREIIFYDLPGIEQSFITDQEFLGLYRRVLLESDVAIWAVHADSRSLASDYDTLTKLLSAVDVNLQVRMMSKLIFVLTKVDLLASTISSPWIFAKLGNEGIFMPTEPIELLIKKKESYLQEIFIAPFKHLIRGQTYNRGEFKVIHPHLSFQENIVYYDGFLEEKERDRLKALFPEYARVFDRLYDNYRVISCSSKFKYNLDLLMNIIIQKLEIRSAGRFEGFITKGTMDRVPVLEAKRYRNIVLFDEEQGVTLDLNDMDF